MAFIINFKKIYMKEQSKDRNSATELRTVQVGEWSNTLGPIIVADKDNSLRTYLNSMFALFKESYRPAEGFEFFFFKETGFPSPIIRIDMPLATVRVGALQGFFEIEARPAGLGVDSALFEEHRDAFANYLKELSGSLQKPLALKMFRYSQNPRHDPGGEKREFAQLVGIPFFDKDERPENIDDFYYLVYGNQGNLEEIAEFEDRSLFPVRDDGNKDYLVTMGAAQVADRIAVSQKLGMGIPFVLKPRKGMWAQDVLVYPGNSGKRLFDGYASENDVHDLIGSARFEDRYLLQTFFNPGRVEFGRDPYLAMARIYAFANLETGEYELSNGIYMARQNIRLHGTSDAITGQLVLP